MSEQRPTDWKGPVALVLAALALLVALSGRGFPFAGPGNMAVRVEAAPQPVQPVQPAQPPEAPKDPGGLYGMTEPVPMMPGDPQLREDLRQMWRDIWGDIRGKGAPFHQAKPVPPAPPVPPQGNYSFDSGGNVFDGIWGYAHGIYNYVQPLLQVALLVLLALVVFNWLRRRNRPTYNASYYPGYPNNQGYPPPPPQAPPPAQGQGSDTPPSGYPGPGVLD